MNKLVELFCDVDDFCQLFIPLWELQCLENGSEKRGKKRLKSSKRVKASQLFEWMRNTDRTSMPIRDRTERNTQVIWESVLESRSGPEPPKRPLVRLSRVSRTQQEFQAA
ncbi:hypothetical protein SRDD_24630 [Serratia sp. DD3]|nr:hypothetical protein SRDD_24630 [Serratia sp. DD3]